MVDQGGDVVPRPDPTVLTTQQLAISIAALRELVEAKIDTIQRQIDNTHDSREHIIARSQERLAHLKELLNAELAGLHAQFAERDVRSTLALAENKTAVSAALASSEKALKEAATTFAAQISHLQELVEEKIRSIQQRFNQGDVAIAAALQAAKEAGAEQNRSNGLAITKSELAVGEQIKQISALITQAAAQTTAQLDDIRVRVTRIEEWRVVAAANAGDRKSDSQDTRANSLTIAGLAVAIALGIISIFMQMDKKDPPISVAPQASTVQIQP